MKIIPLTRTPTEGQVDFVADKTHQVEIMGDVGTPGTFKLYVHENGQTVIRIGKLRPEQIGISGPAMEALRRL